MIDLTDFDWMSNLNGDELGYSDIAMVGLYRMQKYPINVYVDMDSGIILEAWLYRL